jgi:hypothetical protein
MREARVEMSGGNYEKVAQRCIGIPFIVLIWSLLRKLWRHEDMLDNGCQSIGIDFSCGEGHVAWKRVGVRGMDGPR